MVEIQANRELLVAALREDLDQANTRAMAAERELAETNRMLSRLCWRLQEMPTWAELVKNLGLWREPRE